jgi:hypothetical protein
MSEQERLSFTPPSEEPPEATSSRSTPQPSGALTAPQAATQTSRRDSARELILVPIHLKAQQPEQPEQQPEQPHVLGSGRPLGPRIALAAAAALVVVVAVGGGLAFEHRQQANILAERAKETESLSLAVKSLEMRLDAIDGAKSRDDLADLRRSIGEMKATVVSSREFNGALAQLSQRVDKLDHEEGAKVDKLSDRVDHEAGAVTTELAARIDKLEKRIVAPAAPPTQPSQPAQSSVLPRMNANVSMETTGSIEKPRPVLRSYIVLDASDDVALVAGRYGEREVRQGEFLPGAGRIERIERKGASWIVLTSEGVIPAADSPPY